MEYGINIACIANVLGMKKSAELLSKIGFTALDYTPPVKDDNWKAMLKNDLKIIEEAGLRVHQTHAPFNRYGKYGKDHKLCLERCAEATAISGAKYMVSHGDEFDFDNMEFTPEAALYYNHNLFSPSVEFGKNNGFKVAFETVFEDWDRRRFSSHEDELLDLINSFDKGSVACCWDFGHGHVSYNNNAPEIIRKFGSLIECTHLHDNAGADTHQLPLMGKIDWKATVDAFKDIGYKGVISCEFGFSRLPEHLIPDFLKLAYKISEHLWSL